VRVVTLVTWGTLALLSLAVARAATLDPGTEKAWDEYVESATQHMEHRLAAGNCFLWVDESPQRLARVRAGEIVVAPAQRHSPVPVPSGLIHDWMGAVFIPQASLQDVLKVVRDYGHYADLYRPDVADSRTVQLGDLASGDAEDRFAMTLISKAISLKTAFEADYETRYIRVDDRRMFSIARTTRVQELAGRGSPDQHLLPVGTGRGIIWRMFDITRYMQRDGGVYIEFEALALSRDIPGSIRWFVEPLVRRIARNSLAASLRDTEKAVHTRAELADR
jgi:hypothetical protein